jgi:hypothetical protein
MALSSPRALRAMITALDAWSDSDMAIVPKVLR